MAISFLVLKLALSGHFVNFGVFGLYNDSALSDCLDVFIKVVLSIPANDLVVSQKNKPHLINETTYFLLAIS